MERWGKGGSQGTREKGLHVLAWGSGDHVQGAQGRWEKLSACGCILGAVPTGFSDRLEVGEREREKSRIAPGLGLSY